MKILAWVGLIIVIIGLPLSFSSSWEMAVHNRLGSGVGFFITMILGYLGVIAAIIGWLRAKPRFFGAGSVLVGLVYCVSYYGYFFYFEPKYLAGIGLGLLPGLVLIGAGIAAKWKKK